MKWTATTMSLTVSLWLVGGCSDRPGAGGSPRDGRTLPAAEVGCDSETVGDSIDSYFADISGLGGSYRLATVNEVETPDQLCFGNLSSPEIECSRCESVSYGVLLTVTLDTGVETTLKISGSLISGHSWQSRPAGIGTPPRWTGRGGIEMGDKLLVSLNGSDDSGYVVVSGTPIFIVEDEAWASQAGFFESPCLDGVSVSALQSEYPTVEELWTYLREMEEEHGREVRWGDGFDPTARVNHCEGGFSSPESDTSFAPCESSADCDAGQNCIGNFCI